MQVYRGSPPYLPVGPDGDRLFSPSSCAEAVTGDHCSLPLGAPACGCRPGEASLDVYGATPPHLRLVSPSPPSSPFSPVALPQALLLRVSALSCYEVQDVVVSAVSSPAKAAVPSEAQQIHDMVCRHLL